MGGRIRRRLGLVLCLMKKKRRERNRNLNTPSNSLLEFIEQGTVYTTRVGESREQHRDQRVIWRERK